MRLLRRLVVWCMRRRAENATMRECGVSRPYVREVIANFEDWAGGAITFKEWMARAMAIAYRYPKDSGIGDILREAEFAERKE